MSCLPPDEYANRFWNFVKDSMVVPGYNLNKLIINQMDHDKEAKAKPKPLKQVEIITLHGGLPRPREEKPVHARRTSYGLGETKSPDKNGFALKATNDSSEGSYQGVNFGLDMSKLGVSRRRTNER